MTKVDRAQVLAYRASRHQFDRTVGAPVDLAVLDLGVQFASPEGGAVSLAARLEPGFDPSGLRAAWTHRGAPHWHRPGELLDLANALWPLSDDDAGNRLAALGSKLRKAAFSATDAMRVTAEAVANALSDVDEDGITKGELSTAVTAELPDLLTPWCGPCGVAHVNEQLLRLATLPGGGCIVPGPPPVRFTRLERWRAVPKKAAGTRSVVCPTFTCTAPPSGPTSRGSSGPPPGRWNPCGPATSSRSPTTGATATWPRRTWVTSKRQKHPTASVCSRLGILTCRRATAICWFRTGPSRRRSGRSSATPAPSWWAPRWSALGEPRRPPRSSRSTWPVRQAHQEGARRHRRRG